MSGRVDFTVSGMLRVHQLAQLLFILKEPKCILIAAVTLLPSLQAFRVNYTQLEVTLFKTHG